MPNEADIAQWLMQFGAAGVIGWMWIAERRQAGARERQLTEAHDRIREQRVQLEQLIRVVAENTQAVSSLETGQRSIAAILERLAPQRRYDPSSDASSRTP